MSEIRKADDVAAEVWAANVATNEGASIITADRLSVAREIARPIEEDELNEHGLSGFMAEINALLQSRLAAMEKEIGQ